MSTLDAGRKGVVLGRWPRGSARFYTPRSEPPRVPRHRAFRDTRLPRLDKRLPRQAPSEAVDGTGAPAARCLRTEQRLTVDGRGSRYRHAVTRTEPTTRTVSQGDKAMTEGMDRREFLIGGALAVYGGRETLEGLGPKSPDPLASDLHSPQAPAIRTGTVKPVVISDTSGIRWKNGGPVCAVEKAFQMITSGADVLDAIIAGVNIPELDPEETGIGYGGLPNADGVVQLDASLHARAEEARGRRGRARGRADAVARGEGGDGAHRPSPARRQGRPGIRPRPGLQDRGRPEHRALAASCGSSGSGASTPTTTWIRSAREAAATGGRPVDGSRRSHPRGHFWGTINCNARGAQRATSAA